jgi:hypothetical protein
MREIRKADIGGKNFVFTLKSHVNKKTEMYFSASSEELMNKWIKAFEKTREILIKESN